jgi:hypothetical protein
MRKGHRQTGPNEQRHERPLYRVELLLLLAGLGNGGGVIKRAPRRHSPACVCVSAAD